MEHRQLGASGLSDSRLRSQVVVDFGPPVEDEAPYKVVDALDVIAAVTGKTIPQVALNWRGGVRRSPR